MNDLSPEFLDQILEIADELFLHFRFKDVSSGHKEDVGPAGWHRYELVPTDFDFTELDIDVDKTEDRYDKLREVDTLLCKNYRFEFLNLYHIDDVPYYWTNEAEIIAHRDQLCLDSFFELGRCWGEYLALYGSIGADYWKRELVQIDTLPAPQFLAKAKELKRKQALFPASGTRKRVLKGKESKKAAKLFLEKNFPNGLEGRTKKYVHEECYKAVNEWVELKRRLSEQKPLTENQLRRERSLRYLSPLTKSQGQFLKPYKRGGIRNIFQTLI